MTLSCPICPHFEAHSLKYLVAHIGVEHGNDLQFNITCGINNCPQTYRLFSGFRSHVHRKHRDELCTVSSNDGSNHPHTKLQCPSCGVEIRNLSGVSSHLRTHMVAGSNILCPFKHCNLSYGVFSSWTSHVSRAHPERTITDLEDAWHQQPVAMVHGSTHDQADVEYGDETMGDVLDDELLFVNLDTQFVTCYANFILKMQEKHLIPVGA